MANRIQISIPKPCHENWDTMAPAERGRFCMACQKQVIDFTKASDREIAEALKQDKNLCGKLLPFQLNRYLIVPKKPSLRFSFIGAILLCFSAKGQVKPAENNTITEHPPKKTQTVNIEQTNLLHGCILNTINNVPISNAIVKNTKNNATTTSDINGNFSITGNQGDILEILHPALYKDAVITVDEPNLVVQSELDIARILSGTVGGIVVYKRSFFGRIFHKIGNLFRKNE